MATDDIARKNKLQLHFVDVKEQDSHCFAGIQKACMSGLSLARLPMVALRLLTVVMTVFFSEGYLLKEEEQGKLSSVICSALVSVARIAWTLRPLTCPLST